MRRVMLSTKAEFNFIGVETKVGLTGILRMSGKQNQKTVNGICAMVNLSGDGIEFENENLFFAGNYQTLDRNYNNSNLVPPVRNFRETADQKDREFYVIPFEELELDGPRLKMVEKLVTRGQEELPLIVATMERVDAGSDRKIYDQSFRMFPSGIKQQAIENGFFYRERRSGFIVEIHTICAFASMPAKLGVYSLQK